MRPKFQADADLHYEIVAGVLRSEPAIDFQSAQEVFEAGTSDQEVLALAATEGRILVSHDVNTMPANLPHFSPVAEVRLESCWSLNPLRLVLRLAV